ncbi:hypothetical protein C6500_09930 [Candidatus Poribacteria bacterium]|nr:MAG: hypothetical protein C6500_09930 [Candidatus Poribacteria bacterium]
MTKLLRVFVLLLAGMLTVSMLAGCGDIDDTEEPVPVNFVSATPLGSEIAPNEWITVTFDNPPTDVRVSVGTVTVAGKTATITGPFTAGPLALTITWADGIQVLNFTVHSACHCCCAPTITGGTVEDGDTDVDPEVINSDGEIVIMFSEDVFGNIALQTEGGDDVGWIGKVEGNKATLELVKGRELTTETVYVIACKISDTEGNRVDYKITFVTRGKA